MASTSNTPCDPCEYTHQNKSATQWCTNFEEGFCKDCEKVHVSTKITRDHKLISVADYRKIADFSVRQNCENHGKDLIYSASHMTNPYASCVLHLNTPPVQTSRHLEEAAKNVKRSTLLTNLENTIKKNFGRLNRV